MRISDWSSDVCSSDLVGEGDVALEPLTGGVSCDVWKVETLSGPIVVKRPLPQLRVSAEWLAPVERGTSEVRSLRRARGVDPAIASDVGRRSTSLNSRHSCATRMPPSACTKNRLLT